MEALERLHHNHIYPIVLLIKFKSVKQIKEIKDPRYSEKISQKDAKNMYESTQALEADYKPYISGKLHHNRHIFYECILKYLIYFHFFRNYPRCCQFTSYVCPNWNNDRPRAK